MKDQALIYAIPFFLGLLLVELGWNSYRGDAKYTLHDSLSNLGCGLGQLVFSLCFDLVTLGAYAYVYEHFRWWTVPENAWWSWVLSLFFVDLCFYWAHRSNHRSNVLWAAHAVHHQSQEFNLSAALRQSWLDPLLTTPFYLPMALAGFSPTLFLLPRMLDTLYQFTIHTRAIDKLGPLEWVLNTPSHHRVHHGIDPQYIDKNYGGIFILWDRLFGTFEQETIEPTYGTVKPLASWDPLWAQVNEWVRMASIARNAHTLHSRLYVWIAPPEWRPEELGGVVQIPPVDRNVFRPYKTPSTRLLDGYVTTHFTLLLLVLVGLLAQASSLDLHAKVFVALQLLLGVHTTTTMIERRARAFAMEEVRLCFLPFVARELGCAFWFVLVTAVFSTVSLLVERRLRREQRLRR